MAKLKGRKIIGLSESAHTWQLFDHRTGWRLELWFDACEGIVWAVPVPKSYGWYIERFGDYRLCNINTLGDVPGDYKGKIAYLNDAIAWALKRYKDCCDALKDNRF